jgi:dTMP kinase
MLALWRFFLVGALITFEGIEGSGKSTQLGLLTERLSALSLPFVCSKEPGGTALGDELRTLLLAPHRSGEKWCPDAELLLFYADRAQHIVTIVRPSLAASKIVILDRFEDSTRAYQGAQGVPESSTTTLRHLILKGLSPDLTLLLDADPEKTLKRVSARNEVLDGFNETRFDHEDLEFHKRVRKGFLNIASQEPRRMRVINADDNPDKVAEGVWAEVEPLLTSIGFL